jgi:hypothetical protein
MNSSSSSAKSIIIGSIICVGYGVVDWLLMRRGHFQGGAEKYVPTFAILGIGLLVILLSYIRSKRSEAQRK